MRLGPLEIIIILVVVLIIFGATRIKQVGENIGRRTSSGNRQSSKKATPIRHPRLQAFGILIVTGGIILMAVSLGLLKVIAPYTIWGAVIIAVGVTVVIIARRRA